MVSSQYFPGMKDQNLFTFLLLQKKTDKHPIFDNGSSCISKNSIDWLILFNGI